MTGDGTLRLGLNTSGDITDGFGNTLVVGHPGDQSYTVQQTPPSVIGITAPADGTYGVGRYLYFTVTFSEPVTFTGAPRIPITLSSGVAYADPTGAGASNAIGFRYVVGAGGLAPSAIAIASAIDLNGGTIRDAAGNDAVLTLSGGSSTAGIVVDGRESQTITFQTGPITFGHADFSPAGASSGLPVAYSAPAGACAIDSAGPVAITAAGTCTVTAAQPGNGAFRSASSVTDSFTVERAAQTLSFNSEPPASAQVGGSYTPEATSTAGLPVSFSIDPSRGPNACALDGASVRFQGPGSCVIGALQPGDRNHLAAPAVSQTITVAAPAAAAAISDIHLESGTHRSLHLSALATGPGTIDVLVTAWRENFTRAASRPRPAPGRVTVGRAQLRVGAPGAVRLTIPFNALGRRLLHHHRYRRVVLRVWATFTPAGGLPKKLGYYGVRPQAPQSRRRAGYFGPWT